MLNNKEKILSTLKNLKDELKTSYKVKKIGLFGSYVKNSQTETNDSDLLVKSDEDADLFHLIGLSRYLEEIFEIKVEFVSKSSLKEEIKQYILREVIYA